MTATRPLTPDQEGVLKALRHTSPWYHGCGWHWENRSTTIRLLDALVAKGYARKEGDRYYPTGDPA